jgi:hypothetical protein
MEEAARELPGHAVDIGKLAQQFSSNRYTGASNTQVRTLAQQAFIGEALKSHPEFADKVNTMRMRGQPEDLRATVQAELSRVSSTGASKVALCEGMVRTLQRLGREELADVRGKVQGGMSLQAAVQSQKKPEVATATVTAPSMEQQVGQAVERVKAEAQEAKRLLDTVNAQNRSMTTVHRAAEAVIGVGLAHTLPGTFVTLQGRKGLRNGERAGAFIAGELTEKQKLAREAYGAFLQTYGRFASANAQYQRALESEDYVAIPGLARSCEELSAQLKADSETFGARCKAARAREEQFDEAAKEVAVHAAVEAATLGAGGVGTEAFGELLLEDLPATELVTEGAKMAAGANGERGLEQGVEWAREAARRVVSGH